MLCTQHQIVPYLNQRSLTPKPPVWTTTARHDTTRHRARSVDVDTIIESIFSTNGDARLPQPVPLSQMIDLLVDFWEADGLFD